MQQDFSGAVASPSAEASFFTGTPFGFPCTLGIEYVHVTTSERDAVVAMYRQRKGLRYLICDIQRSPGQVFSASTNLANAGTQSFMLINMSQPVFCGFFLLRWVVDLTAQYNASPANTAFGRNWFNCNGWLQPTGSSLPLQPMLLNIAMKSGNNNLLYQASIYDFLDDKSIRYFNHGSQALRGIPSFSYDHKPAQPNACFGSVDFSVVNQPLVFLTFNGSGKYSTIGAWATADIGASSDLQIDCVFFTRNNVDATNYDLIRTHTELTAASLILFQGPSTERRCSSCLKYTLSFTSWPPPLAISLCVRQKSRFGVSESISTTKRSRPRRSLHLRWPRCATPTPTLRASCSSRPV